jgi:hypothetical protein
MPVRMFFSAIAAGFARQGGAIRSPAYRDLTISALARFYDNVTYAIRLAHVAASSGIGRSAGDVRDAHSRVDIPAHAWG